MAGRAKVEAEVEMGRAKVALVECLVGAVKPAAGCHTSPHNTAQQGVTSEHTWQRLSTRLALYE